MAFDELSFLDEHTVEVDAPPEATWDAALRTVRGTFSGSAPEVFGRIVGCEPHEVTGWDEPGVGSTLVGFEVVEFRRPKRLAIEGRHHFSHFAIVIDVGPIEHGSRCRLTSRAAFPGIRGRLYRLAVIDTRFHVLAVRRMLRGLRADAERHASTTPGPSPTTTT